MPKDTGNNAVVPDDNMVVPAASTVVPADNSQGLPANPHPNTYSHETSADGSTKTTAEDHSGFFGFLNNRQELQAQANKDSLQHELDKKALENAQRDKDQEHERQKEAEANRHKEELSKQDKQHELDKIKEQNNKDLTNAYIGGGVALAGVAVGAVAAGVKYHESRQQNNAQQAAAARVENMYRDLATNVRSLEENFAASVNNFNINTLNTLKAQIAALTTQIPDTDPVHAVPLRVRLANLQIQVDQLLQTNTPVNLTSEPVPVVRFGGIQQAAPVFEAPMPTASTTQEESPFTNTATNILKGVASNLRTDGKFGGPVF